VTFTSDDDLKAAAALLNAAKATPKKAAKRTAGAKVTF